MCDGQEMLCLFWYEVELSWRFILQQWGLLEQNNRENDLKPKKWSQRLALPIRLPGLSGPNRRCLAACVAFWVWDFSLKKNTLAKLRSKASKALPWDCLQNWEGRKKFSAWQVTFSSCNWERSEAIPKKFCEGKFFSSFPNLQKITRIESLPKSILLPLGKWYWVKYWGLEGNFVL